MSALSQIADDYLRLRRTLGHKLDEAGRQLPRLVAYLESIGLETITLEAALAWAQQPEAGPNTTVWARRMTVVRGFARYLAGINAMTQVPPVGTLPHRKHRRVPFIYSEADIALLMAQAQQTIPSPLRAATFETLIGLLAATGMRVGEAIRLNHSDMDWTEGLLVVRASKFGKSREVPLRASTMEALAAYARQRDRSDLAHKAPSFFVSIVGTRLIYTDVRITFRKLVDTTGIEAGSPIRPRIHDLRHSFAVHTLVNWYRNGEDVQTHLPRLATYLGHRDPHSTYWYLSAAPELLALAAGRLQASEAVRP
jgi:integrase